MVVLAAAGGGSVLLVGFASFVGSVTLPNARISAAKFAQIVSIDVD